MTDTITAHVTLTKDEMAKGIAHASNVLLRPWDRMAFDAAQNDPKATFAQLQAWRGVAT